MPGREEGLESDDGNRLDEVVRTKEKIGEKPEAEFISLMCEASGISSDQPGTAIGCVAG